VPIGQDDLNWSAALDLTQQSERETYRTIVLDRNGTALLLAPTDNGFLLPSADVPRWQRLAENLTAAMRSKWGCEAICLFAPDAASSASHSSGVNYQVLECWNYAETHDASAKWVPISSLSEKSFQDRADYLAVQRSVAECNAYSRGTGGPFAQLGWFRKLQTWVGETIRPLGFQLKGPFCQFNASPSFNLTRFETDGPAIWFKAVGEPNLREFPVTLTLAQLFPRHLPPILGTRQDCNGWLTPEVEGTNLGETQDITLWETAAAALAKLQIESISKQMQLRDSGARDLSAATLLDRVHPFLDLMGQLMDQQTKVSPPILCREELAVLGKRLQDALCLIEERGIPDTLGHLDLNPGNIIVPPNGCAFLDWAEAYVGHPFFSFQYLLEHFRRTVAADSISQAKIATSYLAPWEQIVSRDCLTEAIIFAPLLAAFAYAAGTDAWRHPERLRDPNVAGYLRSVARRMNREANHLSVGRSPCLS
jgi:hypothetical protein